MGWLRLAGSLKLDVSFAEYRLFNRALLQKRPIICWSHVDMRSTRSHFFVHMHRNVDDDVDRMSTCFSLSLTKSSDRRSHLVDRISTCTRPPRVTCLPFIGVTHITSETHHSYNRVAPIFFLHIYTGDISVYRHIHVNASCPSHERVMSLSKKNLIWETLAYHEKVLYLRRDSWIGNLHVNTSCPSHERVMSRICMSHVSHMNESYHTYEWVISHK